MSGGPVRVLMVEDSADDAALAARELRRAGLELELEIVESREGLRGALERQEWDLVIGDYTLPGFSGTEALSLVHAHDPDVPFIFVSGTIGEEKAVTAMRHGARDYVLKGNLKRLAPAVEREIRESRQRRRQRRAERALKDKDARFRRVVESNMIGIVFWSAAGSITDANDRFLEMLGYARQDLQDGRLDLRRMTPDEYRELDRKKLRELEDHGVTTPYEKELLRRDGSRVPVLIGGATFEHEPEAGVSYVLDISSRKRAEAQARVAAGTVRAIVDASPIPIIGLDRAGRVRLWNAAAESVFGWSADEVMGKHNPVIPDEERDAADRDRVEVLTRDTRVVGRKVRRVRKDGSTVSVRVSFGPTIGPDGERDGVVALLEDVTESEALEAQLLQAQKLEAVGRLAGGVAHDFNNLLTVILGVAHFLLEDLPPSGAARESVEEIHDAAEAASMLTKQLLAFSRKELVEPRAVDVSRVISGIEKMIRRLVHESVTLTVDLASELGPTRMDPGQLEQVVLNLIVNAQDAMPEGGELLVRTSGHRLDPGIAEGLGLEPGDFVVVTVRDNGTGISSDDLSRIFEPFFTTKMPGVGTGLGLSTCRKIVRDAGGRIDVDSGPEVGTTFRVYLPCIDATIESEPDDEAAIPRGSETVLLVEDDTRVAAVAGRILTSLGYRVIEAESGATALRALEERSADIDLVLTDIVLPGRSGREVADRARALDPDVRVLFASGYTEDALLQQEVSTQDAALVRKPFTPASLGRRVRETLDAPPGDRGSGSDDA